MKNHFIRFKAYLSEIIAIPLLIASVIGSVFVIEYIDPTAGSYSPYVLQKVLFAWTIEVIALVIAWMGLKFMFNPVYRYFNNEFKEMFYNKNPTIAKSCIALFLLVFLVSAFLYLVVNL